jgi:hypothetical protein
VQWHGLRGQLSGGVGHLHDVDRRTFLLSFFSRGSFALGIMSVLV